jgi:ABC-type cobalamin/Fe3+-siderophores transport system ATPase subunit
MLIRSIKFAMLVRCYAENYRCLSNFDLSFEPLSVLLGANGSGKSSVIGLIAKLRDFLLGRGTSLELFPPETLTRWDKRIEQTFELVLKLDSGEYLYRLRISHVPEAANNKVEEETLKVNGQLLFTSNVGKILLYNDQHAVKGEFLPDWHVSGISRFEPRNDLRKLTAFRQAVEGILILALNPALVSAESKEKHAVTIPKLDCSDFAGWLSHIQKTEGLARQEAEQSLAKGGLPGFRAFQASPSGDVEILQCIFQAGSKRMKFRLDELSSGQIALVILETAIAVANERRGILILDEPGNFLGLSEIQPLLTRLQDAALEKCFQVVLTAHHPVAVDFLAAAHGLWLEREPSGTTRVQRIHVADDIREGKAAVRISDLIARGWLSGLGVEQKNVEPEIAA